MILLQEKWLLDLVISIQLIYRPWKYIGIYIYLHFWSKHILNIHFTFIKVVFNLMSLSLTFIRLYFSCFHSDLFWTAPEFLRDCVSSRKGTCKGDVYSFSIILQEVVVRGPPYCMLGLPANGEYPSGRSTADAKEKNRNKQTNKSIFEFQVRAFTHSNFPSFPFFEKC